MATGTLKTSILQYGSNSHVTTSEEANYFASDFITAGITGSISNTNGFAPCTGGFAVNQESVAAMQVQVTGSGATVGAYINAVPQGQDAQNLRINLIGNTDLTIAANSSGVTKYDWIYLKVDPTLANNPDVNATTVASFVISRSTSNSTDNGGLAPTYGMLLAVVTVINGAASITSGNIQDRRISAAINAPLNLTSSGAVGWNPLSGLVFSYASNAGNRAFTLTNGTNLTTLLSPGMKFQVARSVTAPTQAMGFTAASSQYATKVSPTGIVFTAAFTCEVWVFPLTAAAGTLMARRDNTGSGGGFSADLNGVGQVELIYGTGASFTSFVSLQSVSLLRWTHVAVSVSSTSAKTALIYLNGTSVPLTSPLTAAATLVQQAVDLRLGALSGTAAIFFNGYLSEARIWSVAQSAAQIQGNMAINCIGTEPNLVFCVPGNGNFNDLTANANSLTATNGAIATQLANPFNNIEYAVLTAISFGGGNTTLTLQCPDGYTIPNQTLVNPMYSTVDVPFGLPNIDSVRRYAKTVFNTSAPALANADQDLRACGLLQTLNSYGGAIVQVRIDLAVISTTDFEFKPDLWLNGTQAATPQPAASVGNGSGRAIMRGYTFQLLLPDGVNTISAGVFLNSGTSLSLTTGAGELTVSVIRGYVTGS